MTEGAGACDARPVRYPLVDLYYNLIMGLIRSDDWIGARTASDDAGTALRGRELQVLGRKLLAAGTALERQRWSKTCGS